MRQSEAMDRTDFILAWLREFLKSRPRETHEVRAAAGAAGITRGEIQAARKARIIRTVSTRAPRVHYWELVK